MRCNLERSQRLSLVRMSRLTDLRFNRSFERLLFLVEQAHWFYEVSAWPFAVDGDFS